MAQTASLVLDATDLRSGAHLRPRREQQWAKSRPSKNICHIMFQANSTNRGTRPVQGRGIVKTQLGRIMADAMGDSELFENLEV